MNDDNTIAEDDTITEKSMAERAKEVGRDGAYLEVDASELIDNYRSGKLQKAQIVVIKSARIELSHPIDLANLAEKIKVAIEDISKPNGRTNGMSDEQASSYVVTRTLRTGLME